MHGKEFVMDCLRSFFAAVTLINVAICVLGLIMAPEESVGYDAFMVPLVYGLLGILPNIVMYSKRELKVGELLIRKVIQLILVEFLVLFAAFLGVDDFSGRVPIFVGMAVSILVIYVMISLIGWSQNALMAKRLERDLVKFQQSVEE